MSQPNPGQPGQPMPMPMIMGPDGRPMQPSPEQIAAMRRQIEADAQKAGMSVPDFLNKLRQEAMQRQMMAQRAAQQQAQQQASEGGESEEHTHDHDHDHNGHHHHGPGHHHGPPQQQQGVARPIQPGPPSAHALALGNYLRSQNLKARTCILNGERKDMFRVKRALRALQSPGYEKLRKKHPELPEITDRATLENTFKLLPMSMLALRVVKADPHEGHDHGPKKQKRVKGLWTVRIEPQQEAGDDMYYVWLYEGSQVKRKLYSILALILIFIVVCYPLWPLKLRLGVYYLSWGFLGLLGLFFAMAIFRVFLFCVTYFIASPGLWLFPNLWEDVSFVDSFKPVWAWHDPNPKKGKKKKSSSAQGTANAGGAFAASTGQPAPASATTTATETQIASQPTQRAGYVAPAVEELADDE